MFVGAKWVNLAILRDEIRFEINSVIPWPGFGETFCGFLFEDVGKVEHVVAALAADPAERALLVRPRVALGLRRHRHVDGRVHGHHGARRRARVADRALRARVAAAAEELVVAPVEEELAVRRRLLEALDRAETTPDRRSLVIVS